MALDTKKKNNKKIDFHKKLILFKFILNLFKIESIDEIAQNIKSSELEEINFEKSKTNFHLAITTSRLQFGEIPLEKLEEYDDNIIRHSLKIQEKRETKIKWKYFQYISLLFTEIYLDKYFANSIQLLKDLNDFRHQYNQDELPSDPVEEYKLDDLNKVAFWNATGSGKTLLMHINILQYHHYLKKYGRENELNRVILLTPNEGLSKQHNEEFKLSSISAEIFQKQNKPLLAILKPVEIIEITKIADEHGDKTVAVDSFEGNNLVLVDEGHRGSSGDSWKLKRDKLCETGFSFEYSATFGQAVRSSNKTNLEQEYSKCILFDYSYKYFYEDGFGKDYRILNLEDDSDEQKRKQYLTACLLAYFQQIKVFEDNKTEFKNFELEKPLWIFVGGSVNAVRTESKRQVSDVVDILMFVSEFIKEKEQSIRFIDNFINARDGFIDSKGSNIFENKFSYLIKKNFTGAQLYSLILKTVFNSPVEQAYLHIENLKGSDGEIGLRIGNNDYFGVINVGDPDNLVKLCEDNGLLISAKEFSDSLFHGIEKNNSTINLLIGSKKFTEGWSSWRVSTMGLMNVGKTEGSQIVQLFGRGVRLKGYNFTLKRSRKQNFVKPPQNIEIVETLNIFGVKADYMKTFREYLEQEGLPTNDKVIEICLPVISNLGKVKTPLKFPRLKDGISFKKDGEKIILEIIPEKFRNNPLTLDLYSKVQSIEAIKNNSFGISKNEGKLKIENLAFLNYDELFFQLEYYKYEKSWYNFSLSKEMIKSILEDNSWYILKIPEEDLKFDSFDKVYRWQEIALKLIKKYCERFYNFKRNEWEKDYRELITFNQNDLNMVNEYKFFIDESKTDIIERINQLKETIEKGELKPLEFKFAGITGFNWENHLYQPLISIQDSSIKMTPVELNKDEMKFVMDLESFYRKNQTFFSDKELYLLRNQGKGRGVGFFEANNFHPDFVLWLIKEGKQFISFIDPKGLMHMGITDPKIQFHKTIKEIEKDMKDPDVVFNSFILSNTEFAQHILVRDNIISKFDFEENNVIFQEETGYIEKIINKIK